MTYGQAFDPERVATMEGGHAEEAERMARKAASSIEAIPSAAVTAHRPARASDAGGGAPDAPARTQARSER